MTKNIIIAAALGVVGLIGFVFPIGGTTIVEKVSDLGSGVYSETDNCMVRGGAEICTYRILAKSATTTPWAVAINATSTLTSLSCAGSVSSTTASVFTVGKGATPVATTTLLYSHTAAANSQFAFTLPATTTQANLASYIFAPGNNVVVGMSGGAGTFSPTGACVVEFTKVL